MSKTVWLINQYLTTPDISDEGHRHYYLAKGLRKHGYETVFVTGSYEHAHGKEVKMTSHVEIRDDEFTTAIIKTPKYNGARGMGRIWNMLVFWLKLYFLPRSKLGFPEVILVSSISLLPILYALSVQRRSPKVKFVLEIRDIWPLTLVELGGFSVKNPFIRMLAYIEKLGYQKADHVVGLMPHLNEHVADVVGDQKKQITWISNGIDLESIRQIEPLTYIDESRWPNDSFVIGYAGSVGNANALEYIVDYMNADDTASDIVLIIVGAGDSKRLLIERSKDNGRILFYDRIPKHQLQSLYAKFDALYLSWRESSIYRYGVAANKMFEYMYAGKPIIMSGDVRSNPISTCNGGIVVKSESVEEIRQAVDHLRGLSKTELVNMGKRAHDAVVEFYAYEKLAETYANVFSKLDSCSVLQKSSK